MRLMSGLTAQMLGFLIDDKLSIQLTYKVWLLKKVKLSFLVLSFY